MNVISRISSRNLRLIRALIAGLCLLIPLAFTGSELVAQYEGSPTAKPGSDGSAPKPNGKKYSYPATIKGEALDEPNGRKTLRGTPVNYRVVDCYPAEPRDLFWQMDQVADANGKLQ